MRRVPLGILSAVLIGALAGPAAGDVKPGTMLGPETAEQARGLLPDEFLERYRKGEFLNPVAEPRPGTHFIDPNFMAEGNANRGKYTVNEIGTIIDPTTGKQPTYIYGPPFPDIDKNEPQAAVKLVWNFFYQSYLLGDDRNLVGLAWISRRGIDREVKTEVWQKFYDGQPADRSRPPNPNNLLFQQLVDVQYPDDLRGTVSLTWRYRDTKRDSTWSYVPALRRTRAVSPTNRSDGFLGSDMSQDDGSYFDGKPEDFKWKVVGEGEMLCMYDKAAIVDGRFDIRPLPEGGWRGVAPAKPRFGWQDPNAKVIAWAPLPERTVLVRRQVYIVEGEPRDKYYLYGKLVLRFEKDGYIGCFNSKYDWRGSILNSYLPLHGGWFRVGEGKGPWRPYSEAQFTMSQNWKLDRGTASFPYADDPSIPTDSLIDIPAKLFDYQALVQHGR